MKSLFLVLGFVFVALTTQAQRVIPVDTLKGVEQINFPSMQGSKAVQVLCTEIGGTSDGVVNLEASLDGTSWEILAETSGAYNFYPNDTLTIVDGAVLIISIKGSPFLYHRITATGTASDTTEVSIKWIR